MMNIDTVKLQSNGYLVNNTMSVPNDTANSDYQKVQEWIKEGGIVAPEFTEEELAQQAQDAINSNARILLANSDWKVIRELERQFLAGTDLNIERESLRSEVI